jgi:hypothetical protein
MENILCISARVAAQEDMLGCGRWYMEANSKMPQTARRQDAILSHASSTAPARTDRVETRASQGTCRRRASRHSIACFTLRRAIVSMTELVARRWHEIGSEDQVSRYFAGDIS